MKSFLKISIVSFCLSLALLTSACGNLPFKNRPVAQSTVIERQGAAAPGDRSFIIESFDPTSTVAPKRLWRLIVGWEPYLLDQKKSLVRKEFQLIVRDPLERKRLELEIISPGGDLRYLKWLESELFPIGNWEKLDFSQVSRLKNETVVVLTTKSTKEESQNGKLKLNPILFPEPFLRLSHEPCALYTYGLLNRSDSFAIEVVLESRNKAPNAIKWQKKGGEVAELFWKSWSVDQGYRISYRVLAQLKENVSKCPMPPRVVDELDKMMNFQEMGIEW